MNVLNANNNFDVLRLLLAFLVFFAHWNILTSYDSTNLLFHLSGYAVDAFFIISGFLIFWSFDNDQNKKHFYTKRFFRIFPLYAFLIILQTLFFTIVTETNLFEVLKYFLANILFLNFLSPTIGQTFNSLPIDAINGSLWTLKNEIVFYIAVPIIFYFYKKWGMTILFLLYLSSVFYMICMDYLGSEKLLVQFPAQLRLFITGSILYILINKIDKIQIFILSLFSILFLIFFPESHFFIFSVYPILLGIIVICIVFYTYSIKISFDFSYSFYILHFPIIQISLYLGMNPKEPFISFITLFMVIILFSFLSEKYIEKRFIKIGKTLVNRENHA